MEVPFPRDRKITLIDCQIYIHEKEVARGQKLICIKSFQTFFVPRFILYAYPSLVMSDVIRCPAGGEVNGQRNSYPFLYVGRDISIVSS